MRFLADPGISPRTVDHLPAQGHDVAHLADQGLHRLPDDEIVEKARAERRTILTVDLDFGDLLAFPRSSAPSVIIFPMANKSPGSINAALAQCLSTHADALRDGVLLSVSEGGVRARMLPIIPDD